MRVLDPDSESNKSQASRVMSLCVVQNCPSQDWRKKCGIIEGKRGRLSHFGGVGGWAGGDK